MNTTTKRVYPWQRMWRKWLLTVLVVFVFIPSALILAQKKNAAQLEQQIADIRATGAPATPEDLKTWMPQHPNTQGTVELYKKAFQAQNATDKNADKLEDSSGKCLISEEFLQWARDYLGVNAEALRLLHEAAQNPLYSFPVDLNDTTVSHEEHEKLRASGRLLALEAIVAAADKDAEKATGAILTALSVGNTLREEPLFLAGMVRVVLHRSIIQALEYMIETVPLSDEQLKGMAVAFNKEEDPEAITRALIAERVQVLSSYSRPNALVGQWDGPMSFMDKLVPGGTMAYIRMTQNLGLNAGDRQSYIDWTNKTIIASRLPVYQAIPILHDLARQQDRSWLPRLSDFVKLNPEHLMQSFARDTSNIRNTYIALGIERYRLAYHRLPDRLDDLTPTFLDSVPEDPFDGQPIRYRPDEHGYVLYSVSANSSDDSGIRASASSHWSREGDIVFQIKIQ